MAVTATADTWVVQSQSAWISPASRLRIPVPCTGANKHLSLDFNVLTGGSVDFDVMLEDEEGEATRLYGPSRRTKGVQSCLPLASSGVAHVTFDNFSSWATAVEVCYTLRITSDAPAEAHTVSRLVLGRRVLTDAETDDSDDDDERWHRACTDQPPVELLVAPGDVESVTREVAAGARIVASVEVVQGRVWRYDIDFGIVLRPNGSSAKEDCMRLLGPCRRYAHMMRTCMRMRVSVRTPISPSSQHMAVRQQLPRRSYLRARRSCLCPSPSTPQRHFPRRKRCGNRAGTCCALI